jgi:hypothetical protein
MRSVCEEMRTALWHHELETPMCPTWRDFATAHSANFFQPDLRGVWGSLPRNGRFPSSCVPFPMGGLFQTSIRRCATRAAVSRPVHPSCGDFKPSTRRSCRWHITFRWRDSAHHNKKRLMTLPVNEFLRTFLLHVLPPEFVRIRYFG